MLLQFGPYHVDLDVERTRRFYESARPVSEGCSCDGCRNFEQAVEVLPLPVKAFFSRIGVDMKKVCECYVCCTNEDGTLLYGGFYHVCGRLLSGSSAWVCVGEGVSHWEESLTFSVSPDFHIFFQEDAALLEEGFPLPVLQLEFSANIPWVLEKEDPYTG